MTLLQIKSHGHERGTTSRKRVCPGGFSGRADTAQRGAELRDKTERYRRKPSRGEPPRRARAGKRRERSPSTQHGKAQHSMARHNTARHTMAQHSPARLRPAPRRPHSRSAAPARRPPHGPRSLEMVQGVNAAGGLPVPAAHPAPGAAKHAGGARRGLIASWPRGDDRRRPRKELNGADGHRRAPAAVRMRGREHAGNRSSERTAAPGGHRAAPSGGECGHRAPSCRAAGKLRSEAPAACGARRGVLRAAASPQSSVGGKNVNKQRRHRPTGR